MLILYISNYHTIHQNITIWYPSGNIFKKEKEIAYRKTITFPYPRSLQYIVGLTGNKFASTDRKTEPEYDYEGVEPIYTEL